MVGIVIFWLFNKMISRIQHPPFLKMKDTIRVAFVPALIGSVLGTVPYIIAINFINMLY